jgi:predicted methyltransferase
VIGAVLFLVISNNDAAVTEAGRELVENKSSSKFSIENACTECQLDCGLYF